jgi:uncharacterized membrane protein YdbT with pleckstrin-like domain
MVIYSKALYNKQSDLVSFISSTFNINEDRVDEYMTQLSYGILGLTFFASLAYEYAYFRKERYELLPQTLHLEYGVFTHHNIYVPYDRITAVSQSRVLIGNSLIAMTNAFGRNGLSIYGLSSADATEMYSELQKRIDPKLYSYTPTRMRGEVDDAVYKIQPRWVLKHSLRVFVIWGIILSPIALVMLVVGPFINPKTAFDFSSIPPAGWMWVYGFLTAFLSAIFLPFFGTIIYYFYRIKRFHYQLDQSKITVDNTEIKYQNVQYVDMSRSIFDRVYGLITIYIETNGVIGKEPNVLGYQQSRLTIPGLEYKNGRQLADIVIDYLI